MWRMFNLNTLNNRTKWLIKRSLRRIQVLHLSHELLHAGATPVVHRCLWMYLLSVN